MQESLEQQTDVLKTLFVQVRSRHVLACFQIAWEKPLDI